MFNIWFMRDNHTFTKIYGKDEVDLVAAASARFAENRHGSLFVRDEYDATMNGLCLHGPATNDAIQVVK